MGGLGVIEAQPQDHVVQFYVHDDELVEAVSRHFAWVLNDGDVAIVIATPEHRARFESALAALGVNVASAHADGQWITADAADTLASFMVDGHPDGDAFDHVVGTLVRTAVGEGRRVHAYGEMVALLWNDGNVAAAIELEGLWNDLRRAIPFALWCAYRSTDVASEEDALRDVCHAHSTTVGLQHVASQHGLRSTSTSEQSFACSLAAPGLARRFVAAALESFDESDQAGSTLVVVSELVTNAVLHAASALSVAVTVDDHVIRVAVYDASRAVPTTLEVGTRSTNGRGLAVVNAWASRWGTELLDSGKVVWAELDRRR